MRRTIIILLALTGIALAAPKDASRIVGGRAARIEQYPFMASMQFSTFGVYFQPSCGGSLITANAILSAAHCFISDPSVQRWRVRLGSAQVHSGGAIHTISNFNLHQNFVNRLMLNDIAIARLSSNAQLSSSIGVARVAGPQYVLNDGVRVHLAGFGHTRFGGPSSSILLHVGVDVINHPLCIQRYAYLKTLPGFANMYDVNDDMLCTGILDVGGKDACQGDSGGPVVHQGDVLVGITSWGYQCANGTYPGVNVRVNSYTNWIVSNS